MRIWYLIRGGVQTGPFTEQELLNMLAGGGLFPQDVFIDSRNGRRYDIDKAIKIWRKTAGRGPKKKRTGLIVFLIIVALIGGFITYKVLTRTSDMLTLGDVTPVTTQSVSTGGGTIAVTGGSLDGLVLDVPAGAYTQDTPFEISTRPIDDHKFGELFDPATPLISIDNGDVFAEEAVAVTIPIEKSDNEFAMGFYYDIKTGELEGIPLISLDNNQITLYTSHFCEIVVSKVELTKLDDLEVITGFQPGIDDWQFTNYGSFIARGGHCAGQSITAMWYFNEMYQRQNAPRLYGLYDNFGYDVTTSRFWRDDNEAYRFASVIQNKISWDSKLRVEQRQLSKAYPVWSMNAFVYAMQMTGQPQYVAVWGQKTKADGTVDSGGHALVAYAVMGNTIFIADPNYPGKTDRTITFNGTGFDTYSSGQNAAAIENGDDFPYSGVYYIGQSAMINNAAIKEEFDKLHTLAVGDDEFPACSYQYLKSKDDQGNTVWEDMTAELSLDTQTIVENLGEGYADKLRLCVQTPYNDLNVYLYIGLNDAVVKQQSGTDQYGRAYFTIDLEPGINDIGLYTCKLVTTSAGYQADKFIEFQRFRVDYNQTVDLRFDDNPYDVICNAEAVFSVTARAAPPDVSYVWEFGNGDTLQTTEPTVQYAYAQKGDYTMSCKLIKNADGKVLGEAQAQVNALDLYGNWNFSYRITESKAVDSLINMIVDIFVKFFQAIFPDADINNDYSFTLKGTTVYGTMYVIQSDDDVLPEYEDVSVLVQLRQEWCNNDVVEVSQELIPGYMVIDGDSVEIHLTFDDEDGNLASAMAFKGQLSNHYIWGTFNAGGLMRGTFSARK